MHKRKQEISCRTLLEEKTESDLLKQVAFCLGDVLTLDTAFKPVRESGKANRGRKGGARKRADDVIFL